MQSENDLSGWFSTYGLITAQRLLEHYKIKLPQEDLLYTLQTPNTFYHSLLQVPLRNVLNGIVLQQAQDYQLYAQKIFIDYLLSGESGKDRDSPGGSVREDLEKERQKLLMMNENFHELELSHEALIAKSQAALIKNTEKWHAILQKMAENISKASSLSGILMPDSSCHKVLINLLLDYDFQRNIEPAEASWQRVEKKISSSITKPIRALFIKEINQLTDVVLEMDNVLNDFSEQSLVIGFKLRQYRTDFHAFILRGNELILLLPDYRPNPQQTAENRESLYFDSKIGEE